MTSFICPVCKKELILNGKSLICENKHNFDIAKSGYVNLLLSQQIKTKHHGDDKLMVRSRQAFLNKGYYNPLLENISKIIKKYAKNSCRIIDVGCGECFYTSHIYEYLAENKIKTEMLAIDISKDALAAGAKRNPKIQLAVASIFNLPIEDNSSDIILTIFAPVYAEEFNRILKNDGIIIRVIPLEKHLWSLKAKVYENPYENEIENINIEGFTLIEKQEIKNTINLACNEDIMNVFTMTPYYYKTSAEDQKKLQDLAELETEIEFGVLVYKKNN